MPRLPEPPWPDPLTNDPFTFVDNPSTLEGPTLYRWQTVGYNCPICQILSNRVHSWDYWRNTVTPGFHPGCDCQLVKVKDQSSPESARNLFSVDQIIFNPTTATVKQWLQHFTKNLNLVKNNAIKYSNAFYEFGDVQKGYESLDGILTSKWLLNFGIPDFILRHPRVNFFTLMGTVAGNLHNLATQIRKPTADLPWEFYR